MSVQCSMEPKDLSKHSATRTFPWNYLPEEIQINTLSKVPAVDLGRLKLVCKHWFDLITKDRNFALDNFALHDQKTKPCLGVLLERKVIRLRNDIQSKRCDSYHYLEFEFKNVKYEDYAIAMCVHDLNLGLQNIPGGFSGDDVRVMCCCDGIIVLGSYRRCFVCNPMTGSSAMLPPNPYFSRENRRCYVSWALGADVMDPNIRSKRYKLVGMRYDPSESHMTIIWHTLGESHDQGQLSLTKPFAAWKVREIQTYKPIGNTSGVFINGAINWMVAKDNIEGLYLLSFDLRKEEVKANKCFNSPSCTLRKRTFLFGMRGSLYLVFLPVIYGTHDDNMPIELWIMNDLDSVTWVREHAIMVQSLLQKVACRQSPLKLNRISPLGITTDASKLIFRYRNLGRGKLICYDFATRRLRALLVEKLGRNRDGHSFVQEERQNDLELWHNKLHFNSLIRWSST